VFDVDVCPKAIVNQIIIFFVLHYKPNLTSPRPPAPNFQKESKLSAKTQHPLNSLRLGVRSHGRIACSSRKPLIVADKGRGDLPCLLR
jgi:hypothetical protein